MLDVGRIANATTAAFAIRNQVVLLHQCARPVAARGQSKLPAALTGWPN